MLLYLQQIKRREGAFLRVYGAMRGNRDYLPMNYHIFPWKFSEGKILANFRSIFGFFFKSRVVACATNFESRKLKSRKSRESRVKKSDSRSRGSLKVVIIPAARRTLLR